MKNRHLLLLLTLLFSMMPALANSDAISLKFNNQSNQTIYINTSQFGGDPKLIEGLDLTKKFEIEKDASKQIFLFDDAPWLLWAAKIRINDKEMQLIQEGRRKLNKAVNKHIEIDIKLPELKEKPQTK